MPGAVNVKIKWTRAGGGGAAPVITSPAFLVAGTVDTLYPTTTFTATGTAPITWSITSGTLPAGMTFSSAGVLAGTPTATSSGSITFTATNAYGSNGRELTLTVNAAGAGSVDVTRLTLVDGAVGASYNETVTATGAAPITWSLYEGTLPTGLSLNSSTGQITGSPSSGSKTQFIVKATNAETGYENYRNLVGYAVKVAPYFVPPYIIQNALPDAVENLAYSCVLSATGDSPITWALTGTLPAGLGWNASTQTLSGTPTATGSFSVSVTATNANTQHQRNYTLVVQARASTRVYPDSLTWIGSFKLPMADKLVSAGGGYGGSGFTITNRGTAYIATRREGGPENSDPNSLYVAEVTIPALVQSTNTASLNRSTFVQNFADSADGRSQELIAGGINLAVKSILWKSDRLYITASTAYEGNGDYANFYSRSDNLSASSSIIGMSKLQGTHGARFFVGYLSETPQRVQTDYGVAPTIAGGTLGSIVANGSMGPSMYNFNALTVANPTGPTDKISGTELLGYPYSTNTGIDPYVLPGQYGQSQYDQNLYWSWGVTTTQGAAWLNSASKRAVLFVGTMGLGQPWYGLVSPGGAFMITDSQLSNKAGQILDPTNNQYKGGHAYPYVVYVWAYDEDEILRVKNGTIQSYQAKPYHVWKLDMPIGTETAEVHGVAHDLANRRIYVSIKRADMYAPPDYGTPIVHVFEYPN